MADLTVFQQQCRAHVYAWLQQERSKYADVKNAEETPMRDVVRKELSVGLSDDVLNMPFNYLKRAQLFGVDTPQGRQALGKAVVTLTHYLETIVEYHGGMPEPGHSTGEILPWDDSPIPLPGVPDATPP